MSRNRPPHELSRLLESETGSAAIEAAWSAFLERYSPLLLRVARRRTRDYDARMNRYRYIVEGLRENDFARLRTYTVEARSTFDAWLAVVANRLCQDHHRKRYGQVRSRDVDADTEWRRDLRRRLTDLDLTPLDPEITAGASAEAPDEVIRRQELMAALDAELEELSPRDRLLLQLRFEDGRPVREIAELMGFRSVFQVYRRLKVVRRAVREGLESRGVTSPDP